MSRNITVLSGRTIFAATICLATLMASDCFAQNGRFLHQPGQRVGRFLGMGYGVGYHNCNPGYDAGYYNPYSAYNSHLISKSPQYLAQHGYQSSVYNSGYAPIRNGYGQTNMSVPQHEYSGINSQPPYPTSQGESVNATFEPAQKRAEEAQLQEDVGNDSDNDFQPQDDANADDQPSVSDDEDEGGFDELEQLKEGAESGELEDGEEAFFSEPSIFMPSSYGGN
jgi:hypothetical protein